MKLYYNHARRRFIARLALGLTAEPVGFGKDPEHLTSKRVVLDLEPGLGPSRLVMDSRGKVITCLAPHMAVGDGHRVPFRELEQLIEKHERWVQEQQDARELVRDEVNPLEIVVQIGIEGWLTPREKLDALDSLGSAAGPILTSLLDEAAAQYAYSMYESVIPGSNSDLELRRWFRDAGAVAALLTVLANNRVQPRKKLLSLLANISGCLLPMVTGACLPWMCPSEAFKIMAPPKEVVDSLTDGFSAHLAATCCLGMLCRLLDFGERAPDAYADYDSALDRLHAMYNDDLSECARLGEEVDPERVFVRDLIILARGGRPDWGADLVDDIDDLPPLLIEDLCLPDAKTSTFALRNLAQRIFAAPEVPMHWIFSPREQIDAWRERRGPFGERRGKFVFPWAEMPEELIPRSKLPGRNDPCLCGSGKKFKKCCITKYAEENNEVPQFSRKKLPPFPMLE